MPRILCTLENASDTINGVKFELIPGVGRVAEVEDEAAAAIFLSINGYEEINDEGGATSTNAEPPVKQPAAKAPAAQKPAAKAGGKKAAEAPAPAPAAAEAAPDPASTADGSEAEPDGNGHGGADDNVF